ncbi:MAG TPA: protein DpdE, partial [Gemmataceae bacterium]|nr:protein DpdE [Gemmataceae bacterium]
MGVAQTGQFVRSRANALGVGKLGKGTAKAAVVEYFVGPGLPPRVEKVPPESLSLATLDCETRIYQMLPDGVSWRAGRALVVNGNQYIVQFPNNRRPEFIPAVELFTRCDLPIPDPSAFLTARITETPLWQERRAKFIQATMEQRGACAGMTGLLSSCIDLEPHQIEVVRRVLQDPVQRYLLADEVGLGKTIEAGVVVRQYVLEQPNAHGVVVLVPRHLEKQWRAELTQRFGLGIFLDRTVLIVPHDAPKFDIPSATGLVVIDEAHQVARWVASPDGKQRRRFETLSKLVTDPRLRLLLLSATPTLHSDEVGFQALLHLLDPVVYPLGDLAGFRTRLARHETVAQLYHLFRPDEEGSYLEGALDQFTSSFSSDARLKELAKELRPLLAYGADPDAPERADGVRAVRAHVSEAYRLHRRLLRNRRADERVEGLLPGRAGVTHWTYPEPAGHPTALLEEWRTAAAATVPHDQAEEYGKVFVLFAEAAVCDAGALAAVVDTRLGEDVLAGLVPPPDDADTLTGI